MKTVSTTEAKRHLGKILETVAGGAEVQITRHGRPVLLLSSTTVTVQSSGRTGLRRAAERVRRLMRRPPRSLASARETLEAVRYRRANA